MRLPVAVISFYVLFYFYFVLYCHCCKNKLSIYLSIYNGYILKVLSQLEKIEEDITAVPMSGMYIAGILYLSLIILFLGKMEQLSDLSVCATSQPERIRHVTSNLQFVIK